MKRVLAVFVAALMACSVAAEYLTSANGYEWDLGTSDGSVSDGGDDAFDGYGLLYLQVSDLSATVLGTHSYLSGFNLALGGRTYSSVATPAFSGIAVNRTIYAPAEANYLRYFDTFTNTTGAAVKLNVVFGGDLGSDSSTTLAGTSSGDAALTTADYWAVTIENGALNPAGPAQNDPVVGVLFGNTSVRQGFADSNTSNIHTNAWEGNGSDGISYRYEFTLQPGATSALVYFLYRGQAEVNSYTPGSLYGSYDDGLLAAGQIAQAQSVLTTLAAAPDYTGLSSLQQGQIVNFTAVPEPSTWALLAFGSALVLIPGLRRRLG